MDIKDKLLLGISATTFAASGYFFQQKDYALDEINRGPAIGRLETISNVVKQKPKGTLAWLDADGGQNLYFNDQIFTHDESYAKLNLGDEITLNLSPNTLIKLGKDLDSLDLNLSQGFFSVDVKREKSKKFQVSLGGKKIEINSKNAKLQIQSTGHTNQLYLKDGNAQVSSGSKLHKIDAGTTIIPKDAVVSVKIDALLASFPYLEPTEVQQLFKLNPTIDVESLQTLLAKGNKIQDLISIYQIKPKADFMSLVSISKFEKMKALTKLIKEQPTLTLEQIESALRSDNNVSLNEISNTLAVKPDLNFEKLIAISQAHKNAPLSDLLTTYQLRPQTPYSTISEIMSSGNNLSLNGINRLLRRNSQLKINDIQEISKAYPRIGPKQLTTLTRSQQVSHIPSISKTVPLETLADIIDTNPNVDLLSFKEYLLINKKIKPTLLSETFRANPNIQFKALSSLLNSNPNFKHSDLNIILKNNPSIPFGSLSKIMTTLPGNQVKGLIRYFDEYPSNDLAALDGSLKTNTSLNLDKKKDRAKLKLIVASNSKNDAFNKKRFSQFKKKNPNIADKNLLALMAISPTLTADSLKNYTNTVPKTDIKALQSFLTIAPKVDLNELATLQSNHKNISLKELNPIYRQNPTIQPKDLANMLETRTDLSPDLIAANVSGINDFASFSSILVNNRQIPLTTLYSFAQNNPSAPLSTIGRMLASDPTASIENFSPIMKANPKLNLKSFYKLQQKYPQIKTSHLQNILLQNPTLTANNLSQILASAPKTEGAHLEALLMLGKQIDSKQLSRFLTQQKRYGIKDLVPLYAVAPKSSPLDVLTALTNDPKLTLPNIVTSVQTNPSLHIRYITSKSLEQDQKGDGLIIIKQKMQPKNAPSLYRIDIQDKIKLSWDSNSKAENSVVVIASDPQFNSIVKELPVTNLKGRQTSEINSKIQEIIPMMSKTSSKIKTHDIPAIVAINPAISSKDFIELLSKNPSLTAQALKSILTVKPKTNLQDLAVVLSGKKRVKPETIRSILAVNSKIDVKDIGDILKVRRDISEKTLLQNVSSALNFKDYKDILINFPRVKPNEINQIVNTNPRIDLRNLYSLLKLQPSLSLHKLNNTTQRYKQVRPVTLKAIAQKRPDTSTQAINSIMESNPAISLKSIQEVIANDPTCSVEKLAVIIKQNPKFDLQEFKKLLAKHPHLRSEEMMPIFISRPKISVKKVNKTFAQNSSLTPQKLNQILIQAPTVSLEQLTSLLQASPSVDIDALPPLLAASSNLNIKELTTFLEKNPQIELAEITPILTLKPSLDFDEWNAALKKHPTLKTRDISRQLLISPQTSISKVKPNSTISELEITKINSILTDYPQINRTELELIVRSNPNINVEQYKNLLDSDISTTSLHKILLIKPKSSLTLIGTLNKKFDLEQVQTLISNHPNIPLTQLKILPNNTPLPQLNDTLAQNYNMSLTDYASFIKKNDDLDARETLETIADHPQISIVRLKELYQRAPDTEIKLINNVYKTNPKFSLKSFIKLLKLHPKRDSNSLLSLLAENPNISLSELTTFAGQNKKVKTADIYRIYNVRQHISLVELNKTFSLPPKLNAKEVADLLYSNTHIKLYDLNQLLRSHPQLTKKQIRQLTPTIQFNQVASTLSRVPATTLVAAIDANPNVDLKSLQTLSITHPNISPQDIHRTLVLSPEVNLQHVSTFLAKNKRYQIYDLNDLLALNPRLDLIALSQMHQSNPEVKKNDLKKLLSAIPFISMRNLASTSNAIPKGEFQAFASFMQQNPTTNLESFNKLIKLKPQLNISKLTKIIKSHYGITVEDLYTEIAKNPQLSIDSPQLMQSILSKKQTLQVAGLKQGSYYWKVSSKIEDIKVESPVTAFRIELGTIPIPLYPKNNVEILTTNFERSVRLRWEKQEAKQYELELTYWDESNKISTSQTYLTKDNFIDLKNLATRKYSWKVRVAEEKRPNASWSKENSFIIKNRPFFIPQYPAINEKIIVNNKFPAVEFKWKGIENTPYVITLSTDKNFREVILKKTIKSTSFTWKKPVPGRFYWKLSLTSNDLQSPYIQPIEVFCSPIRLLTPLKNQKLVLFKRQQDMEFKWINTVPSSLKKDRPKYIVELSENADFKEIIAEKQTTSNRIKLTFSKPRKYFWRIKLKNPSKYDTPSISTPFEVKLSPPPAPPVIKRSIIQEIKDDSTSSTSRKNISRSIASSDENEDYRNTYVDIEWYKVDYVEGYVIEVYRDIQLSQLVHRAKTTEHRYRWKAAVPGHFYYRLASYDYWARQSPFTPAETMTITVPRKTPTLIEPKPDGVRIINRSGGMKFSWSRIKYTSKYQWELAKDKTFNKIVLTKEIEKSDTHDINLPKNLITDIGYHFWRVRSNFPIGDPLTSEIRRVSLENVMEFDHDLYVTGFGYLQTITETTEQDDTYFASEGTVNKGFQLGGSVEYILTGKKLEYGRYQKKFQLSSELTFKTVLNHLYDLPMLEYSLKEKFVSNNFSLWGYNPAFIAAFEKSAHLSTREGVDANGNPLIQATTTFLIGLGITKEYFLFERKLDAYFELLTPVYFTTSVDLYAIPLSSLKLFLRARYNIWGPFDLGMDLSYGLYNNVISSPFTYSDFYFATSLTIKLF